MKEENLPSGLIWEEVSDGYIGSVLKRPWVSVAFINKNYSKTEVYHYQSRKMISLDELKRMLKLRVFE